MRDGGLRWEGSEFVCDVGGGGGVRGCLFLCFWRDESVCRWWRV